jgi:protease-4
VKQFLITVAGVIVGGLVFFFVGLFMIFAMIGAASAPAPQPATMVLALDLREPMMDQRPTNAFAAFGSAPSLLDTITRIDAARSDDRVRGIYIRANTAGLAAAQAEELRTALTEFRAAGKFVVSSIQIDGVRMSMPGYMAVAGSDEVWLHETGDFQAMGLSAEVMFFANTLRRYHMQAQFEAREEYKNAPSTFTDSSLTPAHREALESLMSGIYGNMLANIAADRGVSPEAAQAAVEETPFVAQRAVDLHLVDRLGRPEEAARAALERAENSEMVEFAEYRPPTHNRGRVIAVVQGEGAILSGPEEDTLFGDESVFNSDRIAEALLDASDNDDVAAIVFRVSSPGGSVVASDQILAALRTARERGKPVVVSMGEVAASGGYYVSTHANEIVAAPATITGSIGVYGGKLVSGPALDHYFSINTETLSVGSPLVNGFTADRPFTNAERQSFAAMIDRGYQRFLGVVAEGREMTPENVRAVAGGRVWTGQQALERGLVDHLGGFDVAVARARALAGIEADAQVQLRYYPEQQNPFESLGRLFGASAESAEALVRINAVLSDPRVQQSLAAIREEDASVRADAGQLRVH